MVGEYGPWSLCCKSFENTVGKEEIANYKQFLLLL